MSGFCSEGLVSIMTVYPHTDHAGGPLCLQCAAIGHL